MVDIVERLKDMSEFRHMDRSQDEIDEIMREAADEITRLRSERDAAKAMCDEMAKALEPFAKAADNYDGMPPPKYFGDTDFELRYSGSVKATVTVDQLRYARYAYRKEQRVGKK